MVIESWRGRRWKRWRRGGGGGGGGSWNGGSHETVRLAGGKGIQTDAEVELEGVALDIKGRRCCTR